MAQLKKYRLTIYRRGVEIIMTTHQTSMKKAAEALDISLHHLKNYATVIKVTDPTIADGTTYAEISMFNSGWLHMGFPEYNQKNKGVKKNYDELMQELEELRKK